MSDTSTVHYSLGSWGMSCYWTACGLENIDAWVTKNVDLVTCEECISALDEHSKKKR